VPFESARLGSIGVKLLAN